MGAADVSFDNSASGLTSTNVQDALDDVIAMAQAQQEQMTSSVIVCRFETASLKLDPGATVPHVFTTNECGGVLPDTHYVGALASLDTCSTSLERMSVMNTGDADGPGVVLRKANYTDTASCAGPAKIVAVFFKR